MIGYLKGTALAADVLDVSGVGYLVSCPAPLVEGREYRLWVHTSVREDAIDLFGFADRLERETFQVVLRVSGVGPKVALAILATLGWARAVVALHEKDNVALATVPGIGATRAAKISIGATIPPDLLTAAQAHAGEDAVDPTVADLVETLLSMGFERSAAEGAVIAAKESGVSEVGELLRASLRSLSQLAGAGRGA